MRCRPTVLGCKGAFFAAVIATAFFATAYSNLFFLLLAFLAVLGSLGIAWTFGNLGAVGCELLELPPAPADQPRDVRLRLRARGRTRFQVDVAAEVGGTCALLATLPVVAGETDVIGRLPPLPRGVHALRTLVLRSRYPFGILQCSRRLALGVEVIAHPVPTLPPGPRTRSALLAELTGNVHGGGDERSPAGLRPFRTGDEVRQIHWKASARRGSPVVREYDAEGAAALEVCLDRRCEAAEFERALGIATALLLDAAQAKEVLHLRSQGHQAAYGPGQLPVAEGLRWLAAAATLPAAAPPPTGAGAGAIRLPARRSGVPAEAHV